MSAPPAIRHQGDGALFLPGQVVATPGALALLVNARLSPADLLRRHLCGDWGDLDPEDWAANDRAWKQDDGRILSSYVVPGGKVWVITEWDRSVTTLLLPEEY